MDASVNFPPPPFRFLTLKEKDPVVGAVKLQNGDGVRIQSIAELFVLRLESAFEKRIPVERSNNVAGPKSSCESSDRTSRPEPKSTDVCSHQGYHSLMDL